MNKTVLNEDTENIIKSYIPDIERWISLREEVYTDSFLREGLQKKTVVQLTLIQSNLIKMVDKGELSGIKTFFRTYHFVDIEELKTRKTISWSTHYKWKSIIGNKKEKIEKILKFIDRLDNIIRRKFIDCFYFPGRDCNLPLDYGFDIFKISLKRCILNKNRQHIWAAKALKILLLLVSILKNQKKRQRKVTVK
jgi:hypothetical protein